MIPRLALFHANRIALNHIVMVTGDVMRPLCVRNPIKHGYITDPNETITCESCKVRGWSKTIGKFGRLPETDENGRFLNREQIAERQHLS
jgi:hypothetical protein